jgi:hypothetical protein
VAPQPPPPPQSMSCCSGGAGCCWAAQMAPSPSSRTHHHHLLPQPHRCAGAAPLPPQGLHYAAVLEAPHHARHLHEAADSLRQRGGPGSSTSKHSAAGGCPGDGDGADGWPSWLGWQQGAKCAAVAGGCLQGSAQARRTICHLWRGLEGGIRRCLLRQAGGGSSS